MNIGIIVGSLRKDSFNLKVARHLANNWNKEGYEVQFIAIDDLPLFNEDLEGESNPEAVERFNAQVIASDALFMVTPEYNSGIPGVLKNALDWGSRGRPSAFMHKKIGIIGSTPGGMGTAFSQMHLRQVLEAMRTFVMPLDKLHLSTIHLHVDENGGWINEKTMEKVDQYGAKWLNWLKQ